MNFFAIFWRGLLMGLAEVVPGVSGGTIALLTGIYRQLVAALASFGTQSFALLTKPKAFSEHHHLPFLISLACGMGIGVMIFARVMRYLLIHYPPLVWSFFFGVILVSALMLGAKRPVRYLITWGSLGLLLGLGVLSAPGLGQTDSLLALFVGGAIAVCAWILPAVSGSYMLLILGLYEQVITALSEFDVRVLAALGAGCILGLMSFVRVLRLVLEHFYQQTMSLLCGFMLISTLNLWPWRIETGAKTDWLLPGAYAQAGEPAFVMASLCACIVGGTGLWLLARRSEF